MNVWFLSMLEPYANYSVQHHYTNLLASLDETRSFFTTTHSPTKYNNVELFATRKEVIGMVMQNIVGLSRYATTVK